MLKHFSPWISLICFSNVLFWCAGCDTSDDDVDLYNSPVFYPEASPWPEVSDTLPECHNDGGVWEEPDLAPAQGLVRFELSAIMQPVGYQERITVSVYGIGSDQVDGLLNSPLYVEAEDGVTVIETAPVASGRAHVIVRFDAPGIYELRASLGNGDDRDGTVEVEAYETNLPVWEMSLDEVDLNTIIDNPKERIKVPAAITIDNQLYETKVRLHGGSSRYYDKKSFRFDLADNLVLPSGADHLILRAEWRDKTMLRNYLALELFRNGTWLATPKAEMVHFRINRRYYGVMWHVERIDGDFLRSRGLNTKGSMYEADPSADYWIPGGNLTPLASRTHYEEVYQHQKGLVDYDDLIALIEDTLQLTERKWREAVTEEIDVNGLMVYMAAMAIIQNQDHIKKNYYIYRDYNGDNRWTIFPWDMDISFGHLWTEESDILDETILTDEVLYIGIRVPDHDYYNQLMSRLWRVPEFDSLFRDYLDHIIDNVFTLEFIDARIDNALCLARPEIITDKRKRATNQEYLKRIEEIRQFIKARRSFIQSPAG
ncbi:MAG: hypothetical protein GY854_12680 [Deltaproteobacteria bacterium]|nr:hypothetical protein [Deltaproteobacteria bacterium]